MRIYEFIDTTKYMFHVTPARNIKYIMKDGLTTSTGGDSSSYGEVEERVYFFPTLPDAEEAAKTWLRDQYEDEILALLRVDVSGLELKKDIVDWEYYTNQLVSPDRIKVVSMDF